MDRGPALAETSGSFHIPGARALGQDARLDLLLVGQQRRLNDHLYLPAAGSLHHLADILLHLLDAPRFEEADIHHHIQFVGTIRHRLGHLLCLGLRGHRSQRKADDGRHLHRSAHQQLLAQPHPHRVHAH